MTLNSKRLRAFKPLTLSAFSLSILTLLSGCTTPPPKKAMDNICAIYSHDDDWKYAANKSYQQWGTPPHILIAFIHQESRFKAKAKPPRPYILGFIPMPRRSSAYGYPQAKDGTWRDYEKATNQWSASRTDIEDSLDFVGWYNKQSHKRLKISRNNPYQLYLAYHEGQGGYAKRTYLKKPWLLKVAKKVANRSRHYKKQLRKCR